MCVVRIPNSQKQVPHFQFGLPLQNLLLAIGDPYNASRVNFGGELSLFDLRLRPEPVQFVNSSLWTCRRNRKCSIRAATVAWPSGIGSPDDLTTEPRHITSAAHSPFNS